MATSGTELSSAQLAERLPISRTAVHKHLQVVEEAQLVTSRKAGRETPVALSPAPAALMQLKLWLDFFERYGMTG